MDQKKVTRLFVYVFLCNFVFGNMCTKGLFLFPKNRLLNTDFMIQIMEQLIN